MNAGHEMDKLIAEKVMGLEVTVLSADMASIGSPHWIDIAGESELLNSLLNYSTDISAAWQVFEKLGLAVGKNTVYPNLEAWVCLTDMFNGEDWLFNHSCGVYGSTAPEAICKAALLAVGYEEGETK
jgi:hypothetical protein